MSDHPTSSLDGRLLSSAPPVRQILPPALMALASCNFLGSLGPEVHFESPGNRHAPMQLFTIKLLIFSIFSYASSSTLCIVGWVGGSQFRTSVASSLMTCQIGFTREEQLCCVKVAVSPVGKIVCATCHKQNLVAKCTLSLQFTIMQINPLPPKKSYLFLKIEEKAHQLVILVIIA